jgi:hypothetical protein
MDVLVTGTRPGSLNEDVACYVEFAEEPVFLHVEAQIKVNRVQNELIFIKIFNYLRIIKRVRKLLCEKPV